MSTPAIGDVIASRALTLTRPDVVRYAGASTDFNPIHYSDRHARAIGLDGVIVHGMWTMGAALAPVVEWAGGPEHLVDAQVRFTRPIAVPDDDQGVEVHIQATVSDIDEAGLITVALEVTCGDEPVLRAAKAVVRP